MSKARMNLGAGGPLCILQLGCALKNKRHAPSAGWLSPPAPKLPPPAPPAMCGCRMTTSLPLPATLLASLASWVRRECRGGGVGLQFKKQGWLVTQHLLCSSARAWRQGCNNPSTA